MAVNAWDQQSHGNPRPGPSPLPFALASPFARLLKNFDPSSTALLPRHVERSPYVRSPNFKRRVYESIVDGFLSGPIKRGVGRPRVAANSPSSPFVLAKTSTSTTTTTPTTITSTPLSPQTKLFTPATTAPVTATTCTSALIVVDRRRSTNFVSMPASGSPATTITTTTRSSSNAATSTASASLKSLTKKFSAPQLSRSTSSGSLNSNNDNTSPTSLSLSLSSSLTPVARRLKTSSKGEDNNNNSAETQSLNQEEPSRSIFRRLSPALAARVKLLNGSSSDINSNASQGRSKGAVGRIPADHLRELDNLHRDLSIKVEKRGRIWGGQQIKRERSAPDLLQSPTKSEEKEKEKKKEDKIPLSPAQQTTFHSSALLDLSQISQPSTIQHDSNPGTFAQTHSPAAEVAAPTMAAVEPAMASDSSSRPHDGGSTQESTDLEEYLKRSTLEDQAPPPPPKDTPPAPSTPSSTNAQSYFNPLGLNRTESIFSFSRASFSSQLSQLTSINLPQPAALESSISSIINAPTAVRALIGAAEQIQKWMNKASEVLNGMEAEDDVEWAAAGGREGLDDVDKAVVKFESLVEVYVKAIENVQLRDDIDDVRKEDLTLIVSQMEATLNNWANIRSLLKGVKQQVELAMEWEELWNVVLGDVGLEIDNLSRLIFEMEEGRHKTLAADPETEQGNGLDINELETIVEESPSHGTPSSSTKRLSLALFPGAGTGTDASNAAAGNSNPQDDANLMQLFARMQPLRASLDFLPMRLSMFQARAEKLFPTACQELEDKRKRLESAYKKLEGDAEALRRELGEDRWILVFRNAGKQAQKMCESVERSIGKLQESLEAGDPVNNPTAITKKMESYEAKKIHYIPAIGRVMSIIQKGVNDRLTVNGEVLTLLSDMKQRVDALKASMKVMDSILEETTISKSQQLRDSISSIITDSPANTSLVGTPGSSPASSVIMTGNGSLRTPNPGGSSRRGSSVGSTSRSVTGVRRLSGIPTSTQRKPSAPLSVNSPNSSSLTPSPTPRVRRPSATLLPNKPRWNSSTNTSDLDTGHNFRPLSVTTPTSYGKNVPFSNRNSRSISSSLPVPSPLSRATSSSPVPCGTRSTSRVGSNTGFRPGSRLGAVSPTSPSLKPPMARGSVLDPPPYSKLRKSTQNVPTGLRNRQSYAGTASAKAHDEGENGTSSSTSKAGRPGTALGHSNRRSSLLPLPKGKNGRESATGNRSSSRMDERPPWR